MQKRPQIEGLIFPMSQIAARGTFSHAPSIHKQNEAIVRADVYDKLLRQLRSLDNFPEMINARVALRRLRTRNPLRLPSLRSPIDVSRSLRASKARCQKHSTSQSDCERKEAPRGSIYHGRILYVSRSRIVAMRKIAPHL